MELNAFLQKQGDIYRTKFDDVRQVVAAEGLRPDPFIAEVWGAFFFALRPGKVIREAVAPFLEAARHASENLVVYSEDILHTTITDYRVGTDFKPSREERDEVRDLFFALRSEAGSTEGIGCMYTDLAMNQTTVILKGYPNKGFVAYAERVVQAAERRGVTLRMPWGAHITLARCNVEASSEQSSELAALCKRFSLSNPEAEFFEEEIMMGTIVAKAGGVLIDEF